MVDLLNEVGALRWYLPVRTPSDQHVDDQRDISVIEATDTVAQATPFEQQRRGSYDVPNLSGGEGSPARWLGSSEVDGRAAVDVARRPESP